MNVKKRYISKSYYVFFFSLSLQLHCINEYLIKVDYAFNTKVNACFYFLTVYVFYEIDYKLFCYIGDIVSSSDNYEQ